MTTTLEQLDNWLNAPREIEGLEFKEAKNQYDNTKLLKYCVAISNEGGGKLILGVTDDPPRQVVGTRAFNNPQGIQRKILNTLGYLVRVEELSITNLGAILFAKRLSDFEGLVKKAPRVIVYDGPSKLNVLRDNPGTKGYVVGFQGLLEFITNQIPSNEFVGKAFRAEVFKMFPDLAVRELVANALIHQDFNETGIGIMVELYSDRLEISNPGTPPISTERFIDEYRSRNEKLTDLMRRVGICEERGSGIDRVVSNAEFYQLPAPDFRVTVQRTIAVMFAYKAFDEMDGKDRVRSCYQHCVLRYVTNERMTNQSLRERFHLPESKVETVSRIIGDAIQQGKIRPDDPSSTSRRYAKYVPWWA